MGDFDAGTIRALLDLKDELSPALKEAQANTTSFGKGFLGSLKTIAKVGAAVLVGMGAAVLAVGVKMFDLAADAVETRSLVSVSFAELEGDAQAWAEHLEQSLGLGSDATLRMSGVLFTMTSSMGVAKEAAFEMSTGAVELAADMASFYNIGHEEALNKIRSGLVGEAEPLKQLGILVDEATIKTAAYEAGIAAWGAELTATEKVQARWLAIQNQTIKAQGDLARTIESPSNQIKLMRGQIVQASIDLSVSLLPAFTLVVGALAEFSDELIAGTRVAAEWVTTWFDTGGLIAVTGYIDALTAGVFGTVAVLRDGIGFVVRWKDVIVALGTGVAVAALAWGGYTLAIGLSTAATVVWGAAVAVATGGITLVLPAVIALIAGLTAGWALWGDEITDFVAGIGNRFIGWAESFMDWARPAAAFLGVEFPESLDRFETSAAEVTVELGAMQDAWEASTAAQQAANQDQYTAELIRQAAAGATLTKEQQALVLAQRDGVVGIADLRAGWASLDTEGQAANMRGYAASLEDAESQGFKLTSQEYDLIDALHDTAESAGAAGEAVGNLASETEEAREAAEAFTKTVEGQSAAVDHWGSQFDGIGKKVELIPPFVSTLTSTIEDQSAAVGHWGLETKNIGIQLDVLPPKLDATEQSAGKLDVTLAALAGQMGGAVGQSINLYQSIRQTNDALEEGEEGYSTAAVATAGIAVGFHAVGQAVGGTAGKVLGALGDIAQGFATGGPVGAIMAGIGALAGALAGIGGPSEEEKAARANYADMHAHIKSQLSGTQAYADEVQVGIAAGWDRTLAETRAGFIVTATAAGVSYDEAFRYYEQYQAAVAAGNTDLQESIEELYAGWAKEAAETAAFLDSVYAGVVGSYRSAQDAGIEAYDEVYEAAIASGAGQEQAAADATAAQMREIATTLAAEGEKYAQLAAFEAALEAIRSGNAEGAAAAAAQAASETQAAWEVAMGAVATADQVASDVMDGTWNPESGDVVTDARGAADAIVLKMEQAERDLQIQFEKMAEAACTEAQSIESSFNAIEIDDQSFTIREHRRFSYSGFQEFGEGVEGRQHGGPVRAGHPYLVGEGGKAEIFVPQQAGNIVPSGSGGGGSRPSSVTIVIKNELDGDELTEQHIKLSPRILDRLGLTP